MNSINRQQSDENVTLKMKKKCKNKGFDQNGITF